MSFLDNFSFAFVNISAKIKKYSENKYWEKIENWNNTINFKWIIQQKKDFSKFYFDNNQDWRNLTGTTQDFILRTPKEITINIWDAVSSYWINYIVNYVYPPVIIEGVIDHNIYWLTFS